MKKTITLLLLLSQLLSAETIRSTDNIYWVTENNDSIKEGYTFSRDFQVINKIDKSINTFCNLTESSDFLRFKGNYKKGEFCE